MKGFLSALLPAAIGGAVVAGALLLFGAVDHGKTTTVVQQTPLTKDASDVSRGLTARDIYKRDAPGVAYIRAAIVQRTASPFDLVPTEQHGEATGSGFVIDKQGLIVTNAHVIDGASQVTVSFADKKTKTATVVGKDVSSDLALLRVAPGGLDLQPLPLGNSGTVQVGDPTIAIGNPFGLDRTLTTGVVSALQRRIDAPNGFSIDHVIQTDAAINPGNSGGPLLDAAGRVIGINSQIATGGSGNGNVGIGFAVPINTAKDVIPQLQKSGSVQHAYLGITGRTIDATLAPLNLAAKSGVLVQDVAPGSPAAKAGIRGGDSQVDIGGDQISLGGDVIQKVNGKGVGSIDNVVGAVSHLKPGNSVTVQVLRAGAQKTVKVTLAARPNQLSQATSPQSGQ